VSAGSKKKEVDWKFFTLPQIEQFAVTRNVFVGRNDWGGRDSNGAELPLVMKAGSVPESVSFTVIPASSLVLGQ
jgi:hypothetical protein